MKNILTIINKELRRVFLDRKLIMSIVVLPGLLMFGMFVLMGFMSNIDNENDNEQIVQAYIYNLDNTNDIDQEFIETLEELNIEIILLEQLSEEEERQKRLAVQAGEIDLFIIFSDDFFYEIFNHDPNRSHSPFVDLIFNPLNDTSSLAFNRVNTLLTLILNELIELELGGRPIFVIGTTDLFEERNAMATLFASIFPMMIIISIVSAIVSVTPEMIAGEKERGSLPILLVTSTKRSHLAIAKVLGASIITMASVLSMLIGTIFGFQFMLNSVADGIGLENVYGIIDYLKMMVIFIVTTLVLTGMFSLISAFSRNTKEAISYSSALMVVAMIIPIAGGVIPFPDAMWTYLVPVLNTTIVITEIFMFEATATGLLLTVISNVALTLIIAFGLTRMFESEKIMFNK